MEASTRCAGETKQQQQKNTKQKHCWFHVNREIAGDVPTCCGVFFYLFEYNNKKLNYSKLAKKSEKENKGVVMVGIVDTSSRAFATGCHIK